MTDECSSSTCVQSVSVPERNCFIQFILQIIDKTYHVLPSDPSLCGTVMALAINLEINQLMGCATVEYSDDIKLSITHALTGADPKNFRDIITRTICKIICDVYSTNISAIVQIITKNLAEVARQELNSQQIICMLCGTIPISIPCHFATKNCSSHVLCLSCIYEMSRICQQNRNQIRCPFCKIQCYYHDINPIQLLSLFCIAEDKMKMLDQDELVLCQNCDALHNPITMYKRSMLYDHWKTIHFGNDTHLLTTLCNQPEYDIVGDPLAPTDEVYDIPEEPVPSPLYQRILLRHRIISEWSHLWNDAKQLKKMNILSPNWMAMYESLESRIERNQELSDTDGYLRALYRDRPRRHARLNYNDGNLSEYLNHIKERRHEQFKNMLAVRYHNLCAILGREISRYDQFKGYFLQQINNQIDLTKFQQKLKRIHYSNTKSIQHPDLNEDDDDDEQGLMQGLHIHPIEQVEQVEQVELEPLMPGKNFAKRQRRRRNKKEKSKKCIF